MKRSTLHIIFVIFLVFFIVSPSTVQAASLYIDPASASLFRGDSVTVAVRLDTDEQNNECINAVDAVINYSSNVEPVDVSIGRSIFNVWVEQPVIDKVNRTITFAGGIPNGYCGRVVGDPRLTNVLTEIVLRSAGFSIGGSDEKQAELSFSSQTTAYLNDGRGTKALLNTYPTKIELVDTAGPSQVNDWKDQVAADNISPEEFSITLQKDAKAFSGKYYIVFNTTDKQTGIDHYEVIEESSVKFAAFDWGRADAPWIISRSPYVLKDQSLNSIVRVKAIDKAGNEYIANIRPENSNLINTKNIISLAGITLVALIALSLIITFVRRIVPKHKNNSDLDDDSALAEDEENNYDENKYD